LPPNPSASPFLPSRPARPQVLSAAIASSSDNLRPTTCSADTRIEDRAGSRKSRPSDLPSVERDILNPNEQCVDEHADNQGGSKSNGHLRILRPPCPESSASPSSESI
jgi:hypothetical protein